MEREVPVQLDSQDKCGDGWMRWFKLFQNFFLCSSCQNYWWDILIPTRCHLPMVQLSGQSCPMTEQSRGQQCTYMAHMWHKEKVCGAEGPAGGRSFMMLLRENCGRKVWACMPRSIQLCCYFPPWTIIPQWISESQDGIPSDQIICSVMEQTNVQAWNGELSLFAQLTAVQQLLFPLQPLRAKKENM